MKRTHSIASVRRYFVEVQKADSFKPGGEYVVMTQEGFEELRQWMSEQRRFYSLPQVPDVSFWPLRLREGTIYDA